MDRFCIFFRLLTPSGAINRKRNFTLIRTTKSFDSSTMELINYFPQEYFFEEFIDDVSYFAWYDQRRITPYKHYNIKTKISQFLTPSFTSFHYYNTIYTALVLLRCTLNVFSIRFILHREQNEASMLTSSPSSAREARTTSCLDAHALARKDKQQFHRLNRPLY